MGEGESRGLGKCNAGWPEAGSEVGSRERSAGDQRYGKGSGVTQAWVPVLTLSTCVSLGHTLEPSET